MDAVGRPTDCFAVAHWQLTVLRHRGDCHRGDAAAWSVPLRSPWALPTTERMDPTLAIDFNFSKNASYPRKTHVISYSISRSFE